METIQIVSNKDGLEYAKVRFYGSIYYVSKSPEYNKVHFALDEGGILVPCMHGHNTTSGRCFLMNYLPDVLPIYHVMKVNSNTVNCPYCGYENELFSNKKCHHYHYYSRENDSLLVYFNNIDEKRSCILVPFALNAICPLCKNKFPCKHFLGHKGHYIMIDYPYSFMEILNANHSERKPKL